MTAKRVEVLVVDGCPHVDAALERARRAIDEAKVSAELRLVRVESDDHAKRLRFLGSPTVRVDGVDVDPSVGSPSAESPGDYGLQCRIYAVDQRLEGAPPTNWIASALKGVIHHGASDVDEDGRR